MTEVRGGRFDKKVTFLLVHGTFARGAKWTAPESPLCGALVSAANDLDLAAVIERIRWSGRNRVRDRIEAARRIDCALRRIDRDVSPHVVLVGHSHGGSAIAHFLRRREDVPRVSGCAFLSTPFVATRVRPDAYLVYSSLLATAACVAFAVLSVALSIAIGLTVSLFDETFGGSTLVAASIQLAAALIVGFALRRQAGTFKRVIAACGARLADVETARIEANGCLLLRASSDEAAAALAFAQFVAAVTGKTASIAMSLIGRTSVWFGRATTSKLWTSAILIFCVFYGFYAAMLIEHLISYGTLHYLWSGAYDLGIIVDFAPPWVSSAFDVVLHKILWFPFSALTVVLVTSVLLYSATSIVNAAAIWAFGWANFVDAMFAEVSAEPTPFGAHVFTLVRWSEDDRASSWLNMNHSATYQSPACLDALRSWLLAILRGEIEPAGPTSIGGERNGRMADGPGSASVGREPGRADGSADGPAARPKNSGKARVIVAALAAWREPRARRVLAVLCLATATSLVLWLNYAPLARGWRHYTVEVPYVRTYVQPYVLTQEQEAALEPSTLPFQECAHCPQMIVLPRGRIDMGSERPVGATGDGERPVHEVKVEVPLAVSKTTVTVEQWRICVEHGDCSETIGAASSVEAQQPVTWVSRSDAVRYTAWLSKITGKPYRLLSEAEWEYAARANTSTSFFFGDDEASLGSYAWFRDNSGHRVHTVAQKQPNPFGLYDMQGNVWQWVEDCFHPNYGGAPSDGSAWIVDGDCGRRMIRGGDYARGPDELRSAHREHYLADGRLNVLGIRVARTLSPGAAP